MNARRRAVSLKCIRFVPLMLVLSISLGCTYAKRRALDLTDIVDVRYDFSLGLAGAKVEVTEYLGVGLGIGAYGPGQEWYGRRVAMSPGGFFFHIPVVGVDDTCIDNMSQYSRTSILGFSYRRNPPPPIERFRVGVRGLVPLIHLGVFINLGEVYDFLAGLASFDPAEDDEISKGEDIDLGEFNREKPVAPQEMAKRARKAEEEYARLEMERQKREQEREEKAKQEREKRDNPTQ